MKRHIAFFAVLIACIFIVEGIIFLLSVPQSYEAGFRGWALFSLFISAVHFFIALGLIHKRRWAPHLGIFFQLYIILNFVISNFHSLYSPVLLPAALTVLSVSAFITTSLFILRNEFTD